MSSVAEELWSIANDLRGRGRSVGLAEIVTEASKRGISVSWRDLPSLPTKFRGWGEFLPPTFLCDFLIAALGKGSRRSALDPRSGTGVLLLSILESDVASVATGIEPNESGIRVSRVLDKEQKGNWILGDALDVLPGIDEKYDIILSLPPLGMPNAVRVINGTKVHASLGNLILLESLRHLSDDGTAAFVVAESFFSDSNRAVHDAIGSLGTFMNAIIALPEGVFAPHTTVDTTVLLISKTPTDSLFVGRLSTENDHKSLVENLRKRRPGAAPELGRLVKHAEYRSWKYLSLSEEIEDLGARTKVAAVPLEAIALEINLGKRLEDGGFDPRPNSVYLPMIGTSGATTSLSDLTIKPQNVVQLVINPDKALAEYVAGFFNSPLGKKVRDSVTGGSFIPKITKTSLKMAMLFLPPLRSQSEAVGVDRSVREATLQLQVYSRKLWAHPLSAPELARSMESFSREAALDDWLETLPFPLASVLWHYHAMAEAGSKCERLLKFFEAASEFVVTVLLSGLTSDPDFFENNRTAFIDSNAETTSALTRSTFGGWVHIGERLAKFLRRKLSSGEVDRATYFRMFRSPDAGLLEVLTHKDMFSILNAVKDYRNDWGHGGVVGGAEAKRRLDLAEAELTRFRELVAGSFETWTLARPGSSTFQAGIFSCQVDRLMGSRTIFVQSQIESLVPLDLERLFLIHDGSRDPLALLPLFKMMPSPKTAENACYFYNRVEGDNIRWVSYHFEPEPEVLSRDTTLTEAIKRILESS